MSKRTIDMTDAEHAAYSLGLEHGKYNATNCGLGKKVGVYGTFSTTSEAEAYEVGYGRGFNSIEGKDPT